jgi:hypothetical protein
MLRKIAFVMGVLLWLGAAHLPADELLLEQFYGNGVHSYNQGDFRGAYDALTSAVDGGTNDPRVFYFRGLTYLQLGRDPEAKSDFEKGAELEVGDSADVYPVNRSLERVQGSARKILEQYRTKIHAVAVQRTEKERQARYEQRAAAEQEVLRQVTPAQMPSNATDQPVPSAGSSIESSGMDSSGSPKGGNLIDKPATEPVKNPFDAGPTQPDTKPAPASSDNPFGGSDDAKPAKPMTSPTPAVSDDPFGSPTPAAATKPATQMPAHPAHNDGAAVQPTAGGLGSLYRAVSKGTKSDQPVPPGGANQSLPGMIQGMFGQGPAAPTGAMPAGAAPAPGGAGPPPPDNANPLGEATPAATNPAAMPATTPPATVTPMPAPVGGQPAAQPTTPAPAQSNNPTPPKDDNPFN